MVADKLLIMVPQSKPKIHVMPLFYVSSIVLVDQQCNRWYGNSNVSANAQIEDYSLQWHVIATSVLKEKYKMITSPNIVNMYLETE